MEEQRTSVASDLKNLEKAVPRKRLLAYVAVIALVPALAVWAMLSARERGQGDEASEATQGAQEEAGGQEAAPTPAPTPAKTNAGGSVAPSTAGEWYHAVTPDGKYGMDLPSGTKLTQSEGVTYIVPEKAGALPFMAIKIATGVDKQGYKPSPTNSVMMDIGLNTYWLYTWQFKTWDPFARVVASFKVL